MTFPALALVTSGALGAVVEISLGLEIDVDRLRANVEMTNGQIMAESVSFALAEKMGRAQAHALVRELSRKAALEKRPFKEVLLQDSSGQAEIEQPRNREAVHPAALPRLVANLHRPAGGCKPNARAAPYRDASRGSAGRDQTARRGAIAARAEVDAATPRPDRRPRRLRRRMPMAAIPLAALLPIAEAAAANSELKVTKADRIEPPPPAPGNADDSRRFHGQCCPASSRPRGPPPGQDKRKLS